MSFKTKQVVVHVTILFSISFPLCCSHALFLLLCPKRCPYAKSIPSFEQQFEYATDGKKKKVTCSELPLLKRKALILTGYFSS